MNTILSTATITAAAVAATTTTTTMTTEITQIASSPIFFHSFLPTRNHHHHNHHHHIFSVPLCLTSTSDFDTSTTTTTSNTFENQSSVAAALFLIRGGGGTDNNINSNNDNILDGGLDLARTMIRLDSINIYSIVAALVLEAAFKLYTDTDKDFGYSKTKGEENNNNKEDNDNDNINNSPSHHQNAAATSASTTSIFKRNNNNNNNNIKKTTFNWKQVTKFIFVLSSIVSILCGAYTTVVFSLLGLYSKTALGMGQDVAFVQFYTATAMIRKRAFDCFVLTLLSFELCFTTSLLLNYNGKLRWWSVFIAVVAARISWIHWQDIISMASVLIFKKQ